MRRYFDTLLIRYIPTLTVIEMQRGEILMNTSERDDVQESESAASASDDLQTLLVYLKTLADQTRLRILGLLAAEKRSVEELATLLDLKPPPSRGIWHGCARSAWWRCARRATRTSTA